MLSFLRLTDRQLVAFAGLKTSRDMKSHGPLHSGDQVPVHTHDDDVALYVVTGSAVFGDGEVEARLGDESRLNAVLVPKGHPHGWRALGDTVIEHTFGHGAEAVLAAA